MASTITHAIFSIDVFEKINSDNGIYDIEYIKTFAQGPDPLNFYNLDIPFSNNYIRKKYPGILHKSKTKNIFLSLINYIIENKLYNDKYVMSYLYGMMCHYFLDSNSHPYIIYHTGVFRKHDKNTYKYNGLHSKMEVNIDLYLIKNKLNIEPKLFKLYNYCFNINKFSKSLSNMLNYCYKHVYNINNFDKIYYKAIKDMKRINKNFRYDRFGIKKFIYIIIDSITPKSFTNMSSLSYYDKIDEKYLNLKNNNWVNPTNNKEIYNESFIDIYNKARNECINAINKVNHVIYSNGNIEELNKIFLNKSYVTGQNCDLKTDVKYFKF